MPVCNALALYGIYTMVIYLDTPNDTPRAVYSDTEGHIIRYNLTFSTSDTVVFESKGTQPGPRYRLSYRLNGRALDGKFEVAPPGSEYKAYRALLAPANGTIVISRATAAWSGF